MPNGAKWSHYLTKARPAYSIGRRASAEFPLSLIRGEDAANAAGEGAAGGAGGQRRNGARARNSPHRSG